MAMHYFKTLKSSLTLPSPIALTIGSFDGVHRGHQKILTTMRQLVGEKGTLAVITFSNHPSDVLENRPKALRICSTSYKLQCFEKYSTDIVFLLEFTNDFAAIPYDIFLRDVKKSIPFDYLVLGEKAHLGKDRLGTPEKIEELGKTLNYQAIFLTKETNKEKGISSRTIRQLIEKGNLQTAEELLGHPFVIETTNGKIDHNQCLPPSNIYPAKVHGENVTIILSKESHTVQISPKPKESSVQIIFQTN